MKTMEQARYLIRFDDICPTMNWAVWETVESHLSRFSIRPILAVVPDNRDPKLVKGADPGDFWKRVRQWQSAGFTIALHGYQHLYVNKNGGLMRLSRQSEFAGVPRLEQERKLRAGLSLFSEHGIRADAWVAPAHSFDRTTLSLLAELGVSVISDGMCSWPFTDKLGLTWVPQQLWDFQPRPAGIWTICCHHNGWSTAKVRKFGDSLEEYCSQITDIPTVIDLFSGRRKTAADQWTGFREWAWNHYLVPSRVRLRRLLKISDPSPIDSI